MAAHQPTESLTQPNPHPRATQGADVASSGSSLTSVTSSILRGTVEDGRVYAVYGKQGRFRRARGLYDSDG